MREGTGAQRAPHLVSCWGHPQQYGLHWGSHRPPRSLNWLVWAAGAEASHAFSGSIGALCQFGWIRATGLSKADGVRNRWAGPGHTKHRGQCCALSHAFLEMRPYWGSWRTCT